MIRSTMYGTPPVMLMHSMREAAASGDLERMKAVARRAEEFLKNPGKAWLEDAGDVSDALEALKLEIAKLENQESQE